MKTALFHILVLFVSGILTAQNAAFDRLGAENGMQQSVTYGIQQDFYGNIWIATEEGVVRFNSKYSEVYNNYHGLPDFVENRIGALLIDSQNRIWIGTEKGLCLFNPEKDTFEYIGDFNSFQPTLIKSIVEDRYGNIWIGAFNGIWNYNVAEQTIKNYSSQKKFGRFQVNALSFDVSNKLKLGTNIGLLEIDIQSKELRKIPTNRELNIISLAKNKSDFIIGTRGKGLFRLDRKFETFKPIKDLNQKRIRKPIRDISRDLNGNLYVATDGAGIFYLDSDYKILDHFVHNDDDKSTLSSNGIYKVFIDRENIVWIATYGGGINYLNKRKAVFKSIQHKLNNENSLKSDFTRAIESDGKGNLWFGTKSGVSVYNQENNQWTHLEGINDIVLALELDNNFMWAGTFNNGLYKINCETFEVIPFKNLNSDIEISKIYALLKDSRNRIWVGGIEADLTRINGETVETFPVRDVKSMFETSENDILIGGRAGIAEIDKNDRITKYLSVADQAKKVNFLTINSMVEQNKNQLIIGTNGAGLLYYDKKEDNLTILNRSNGLPSDNVQGVIKLENDELWVSTSNGLAQINIVKQDTIIHVFNETDGLASTEFNYGSYKKFNEDLIAFGGVNGVSYFNPSEVKTKDNLPVIFFEEFSIFNETIAPDNERFPIHINNTPELHLKSKENSISFKYVGVQHNGASKIKYSWKLNGFNEQWSKPSFENTANFTNLDYGAYEFEVKASNSFGEWGILRSISFTIATPWYLTWWAYVSYAILITMLFLYSMYVVKLYVSKKGADEQIEFFNNLTHEIRTPLTILLSSLEDVKDENDERSKKQAKKTIKRLNSLFDQMLNFRKVTSAQDLNKKVDKIQIEEHVKELIKNFSPLIKEHSLNFNFENHWSKEVFYFDKETFDKIVFNLLSNAIKYTPDGGKIDLYISESKNGNLVLKVQDNGIGIPEDQQKYILKHFYRARNVINSQAPGTGLGLMMVKKMVQNNEGSISFKSSEGKGTCFKVAIPDKKELFKNVAVLDAEFSQEMQQKDIEVLHEFKDSKVLIVEDNDELRKLLVLKLSNYFEVFEATDGKEGLKKAQEMFPDVIVTDLIMPHMDGMEMANELFKDVNLNHIPVFMMSVLNNSKLKVESIENGISEFIEKPIDINLLLAKIANNLSLRSKLREKYLHEADKDEAVKFKNSNDEAFILKLEQLLIENISDTSFSVYDLCNGVGMSRTSLYMKLKNLIGLSPQDFIIHTRLKFAKSLLIKGDLTIKEIAYQSGFSNPKYFSTSFKKYFGVTPSGFNKTLNS